MKQLPRGALTVTPLKTRVTRKKPQGGESLDRYLCVLATFDEEARKRIEGMNQRLREAGFTGRQTLGIPPHITLHSYPFTDREEVTAQVENAARSSAAFSVDFRSLGLFGLEVLFLAPDANYHLLDIHEELAKGSIESTRGFTPHATLLIEDPKVILQALPIVAEGFQGFSARVSHLQLFSFFPATLHGVYPLKTE